MLGASAQQAQADIVITASTAGLEEQLSEPYLAYLIVTFYTEETMTFEVPISFEVASHLRGGLSMWGHTLTTGLHAIEPHLRCLRDHVATESPLPAE